VKDAGRSSTLEKLEGLDWGDPATGETPMIRKCLALRRKPVADFSIEDLRLALGQQMGVVFLLPLAMHHLEKNPLAQGGLYPGDLLQSVLRLPFEAWTETEELRAFWTHLPALARAFLAHANAMDGEQREIFSELIRAAERAANIH
jgi:hypothetical protein